MATVDTYLDSIKSAIYGEDVRDSIVNAIKAINDENATLSSEISNSVSNTLNEFRTLQIVDQLPETGNSKYIYAVSSITYGDADSNDSEYNDWEEINVNPTYIQVPITNGVYTNSSANAFKPVMARYYLTNSYAMISNRDGSSHTATVGTLNILSIDLTVNTQYNHTKTFETISLESCDISDFGSGAPRYGELNLTFKEFVYDSDDRLWKFNRDITVQYRNMSVVNIVNGTAQLVPMYDRTSVGSLLDPILFCHDYKNWEYASEGITRLYYNGSSISTWSVSISTIGKISEYEYDTYGYLTESNSVYGIIAITSDIYFDGTPSPDIPNPIKNWSVPLSTGTTATMYVWSDAIQDFVSLLGNADPRILLPTGYSETLDSSDWESITGGYSVTIEIPYLDLNKAYMISVSPNPESKYEYTNNNVYCKEIVTIESGETSGLVFMADTEPSTDLDVGIIIQEINGSTVINNE